MTSRTLLIDEDLGAKVVTRKSILAVGRILNLGILSAKWQRSSGGGRHWIVTVDRDLTPIETVAIQACMGDDLKRSTMNLGRVLSGNAAGKDWNILYERKIYTRQRGQLCPVKEKKAEMRH